jgi:putative iron-regulated protein
MDENHIDAVNTASYIAAPGLNIVGNKEAFPAITPELIAAQNESGGEKNVASGYHAIEFLLWGQDLNDPPDSAGRRPFTDYVANGDATSVAARRGQYLKATSTLLIRDLDSVVAQWRVPATGMENYRTKLVTGDVYTGLKHMITGMTALAEVEMAGERMNVSLLSGDQEEEQSCFSDTSADDLRHNAQGIENVYLGRYKRADGSVVSGPALVDLVKASDARVAEEMTDRMTRVRETLAAIHDPYDREIQAENAEGKARVQAGIDALRAEAQSFARVALSLKIFLSPIEGSGD